MRTIVLILLATIVFTACSTHHDDSFYAQEKRTYRYDITVDRNDDAFVELDAWISDTSKIEDLNDQLRYVYNKNKSKNVTFRFFDDSIAAKEYMLKTDAMANIDSRNLTNAQVDEVFFLDQHYLSIYNFNPSSGFREYKMMSHYASKDEIRQ